ncbi:hypothetical protein PIB30_086861 [Stylosanthes scabra]|uniref:Uncharacterized protein n=1 Tax=Stylosanthes scabra TaxID=79078 RepID=A0ABU6YTL0_9FABA|nr:hypothetical protein [Stylosanthes scabra]
MHNLEIQTSHIKRVQILNPICILQESTPNDTAKGRVKTVRELTAVSHRPGLEAFTNQGCDGATVTVTVTVDGAADVTRAGGVHGAGLRRRRAEGCDGATMDGLLAAAGGDSGWSVVSLLVLSGTR